MITVSSNRTHFLRLIGQPPGEKGRATKYNAEEHCQLVRDMAEQGEFQEAWACEIGVTIGRMREWVHEHEEFRDAVIIAHQLLVTYWTRQIAKNVNAEGAKPGMYQMLMKRFPAIYGKAPIDLQAWLLGNEGATGGAAQEALTADTAKIVTTDDLTARLDALRRRREEEQE